jgi:hypothetical protein
MLVTRNPFAREELHRERVKVNQSLITCAWCGNVRGDKERPWLYRFWVERDDRWGSKDEIKGLFCSKECLRSYYD